MLLDVGAALGAGSAASQQIVLTVAAAVGTLAGGALIIRRDALIKQSEHQFGIVHKHVTGAGDGLDGIVTA